LGDGGTGGDPTASSLRVGPLALSRDGSRVYVASDVAPLVFAARLEEGRLLAIGGPLTLDSLRGGVRRLRLSPEFTFGEVSQGFLYAFASDGTVHVVLARETRQGMTSDEFVECETNPDPRMWNDSRGVPGALIAPERRGCLRLDTSPLRRPRVKTPGIVIPSGAAKDVAFQTVTPYQVARRTSPTAGPTNLKGTFGWIATSVGTAVLLNILPDREAGEAGYGLSGNTYTLRPDPTLVLAHQIRNMSDITAPLSEASGGSIAQNAGPPRAYSVGRYADWLAYTRPDVFRFDDAHLSDGTIATSLSQVAGACKSLYDICFPDVAATRSESFTFTFRGTLPNSLRATGNIDDAGWAVEDQGQVFCTLGTQPGDIFLIGGCVLDSQCPEGEVCVSDPVAPSGVTGLCFPKSKAEQKREECFPFLSTLRQYRIVKVYSDRLGLAPAYEIRNLPGGCDPAGGAAEDDRCNAAAPTDMPSPDLATRRYACEPVPWPTAHAGECVRRCGGDLACGEGYTCDANGRCVAGPALTAEAKACVGEYVNYALQVGDGYLVSGNVGGSPVTGFLHRIVPAEEPDASGHIPCVDTLDSEQDEAARAQLRLIQGRIQLMPPPCVNSPPSDWPPDPNPCRIDGYDEEYRYKEGSSETVRDGRAIKVFFANTVVNVGFFLGRLDEAGKPVVFPPPSTNYYLQVDVGGWFQPYTITASSFLPETIVAAPDGYLYVVDSGLDSNLSGLRGQVVRLDPSTGALDTNFIVR